MLADRRNIALMLLAVAAIAAEAKPAARTDLYDEPLPSGAIARLGRGAFPRLVPAATFAFSPDGKRMASVAPDGTLRLETPRTGLDLLRHFQGPHSPTNSAGVSLDGRSIHCGGTGFVEKDGNWLLTTTIHKKHPRLFSDGKEKWLFSTAISPDRTWLAAACPDGTLRIWAAKHLDALRQLQKQNCPTHAVVFSPDGKQAATIGKEGAIRLWDTGSGKEIRRLPGLRDAAIALAYSADGKVLAAAWPDGAIRLWETASGKERARFQFDRDRCPLYAVAVSPDGQRVAVAGGQGIEQWNVATRKQTAHRSSFGLFHRVFALAFSPSGKHLVAGDIEGDIMVEGEAASVINPTLNKEVHSVAFAPDGATVATAGVDGLRLWETRSGREKRRLIWNQEERVRTVAFSPDGGLLASGEDSGLVRLWEMPDGREKQRFEVHKGWIMAVGFLRLQTLAAGGINGVTRLWDTTQGRELRSFGKPDRYVHVFAISSGKPILASVSWHGGVVQLWDGTTGREQGRFQGNLDGIRAAALSPTGEMLATTSWDKTVRLWDVATRRERNRFPATEYRNNAVAFSPDGKILAILGPEAIQLMETATGRERAQFESQGGSINGFAFSADGKMLASANTDSTALVWDTTGRCPNGHWQTHEMSVEKLQSHWRALAGEDAAAAHRAIWALVAAPRQTMLLLRKHLQPAAPKDIKRLPNLLADLDSDQFAVREAAMRELEGMGDAAEVALRKLLAKKPSLEVRRRAELIVKKLASWPVSSSDALRNWRALEVLEHLGTADARQLLQKIAAGARAARLTRAAKAALQRLTTRHDTMP